MHPTTSRIARNIALAALLIVPITAEAQSFTNIADSAGVEFTQSPDLNVPIGGGAIWEDYNGDGFDDVYLVSGGDCNKLFLNDGTGNFIEDTDAGGAGDCNGLGHGGTSADFDNDGDADLYVTNWGQNRYYRNRLETGTFGFEDATLAVGMGNDPPDLDEANSSSAVAGDYDNDGDLDLYVGNHWFSTVPVECNPDYLWRNEGDGTFTDVGSELGIAHSGLSGIGGDNGCALAATWTDFDEDGDMDLMIVNDFGPQKAPNRLYINEGPGGPGGWTFTDASASSGFDYVMFGMGIAKADYDLDGDYDYYMVDIGNNNLAQSQIADSGSPTFIDTAAEAGVLARDFDTWGGADGLVSWGPVFADLDHDGREDLIVTNGGASEENFGPMFGDDYVDQNTNYIYHNNGGGEFVETHDVVGIDNFGYHRTGTVCDIDNDGDLDIHFGVNEDSNLLYRNDIAEPTNWLKVDVEGRVSNRDGIGTKIEVAAGNLSQKREVEGGSSFLSLNCRTAHFGLGPVEVLDTVNITFPSGVIFQHRNVPAGTTLNVVEPLYNPEISVEVISASPGEEFEVPVAITNIDSEVGVFQMWAGAIDGNGNPRLLQGPLTVSLNPGDTLSQVMSSRVPENVAPGTYSLVVRTGTFPGGVDGQAWVDLVVE